MAAEYSRSWPDKLPIWLLKIIFNIYAPFLGAGIRVKQMAKDFRFIEVKMNLTWCNKNYVGTQFGGSIYSMTDPFYMFILIKNLGRNYIVWDKAAQIEFKKPGKGTLYARFYMTEEEIRAIKQQADTNEKYVFDKSVDVVDADGVIIATVIKTLYVRKKR